MVWDPAGGSRGVSLRPPPREVPGAHQRAQGSTRACRAMKEGEAPQATSPGLRGGGIPPRCLWDKRTLGDCVLSEREPAPQPRKGQESTATVLTTPRQWHLPAVEAIYFSMKEGQAPRGQASRSAGGVGPPAVFEHFEKSWNW